MIATGYNGHRIYDLWKDGDEIVLSWSDMNNQETRNEIKRFREWEEREEAHEEFRRLMAGKKRTWMRAFLEDWLGA